MRLNMFDSQQAMSFLVEQTSFIEAEVYKIQYPEIVYSQLIPIDSSANEWVKSITYYSMDKVGAAKWYGGDATDIPLADVNRSKFETGVEMAGIGYRYTLEELGFAMMVPGMNLSTERAEAASFAYESFMDKLAWLGDTEKALTGAINNASVTRVDAANSGTGSGAQKLLWLNKTADQQIADVQAALTGVYEGSNTVEMADTVLLPVDAINQLSISRIPNTTATALEFLAKNNLYTHTTGNPLTIRGVLGLGTAGSGGVGRMMAYRRDPRVIKMHVPMRHKFLQVWQTGPITFDVPGIFRTGSVEVRRPSAVRYVDGITDGSTP